MKQCDFDPRKDLFDHQVKALNAVCDGLKDSDRGKLIMACGTGKTFTSLRIAEKIAGAGKSVSIYGTFSCFNVSSD